MEGPSAQQGIGAEYRPARGVTGLSHILKCYIRVCSDFAPLVIGFETSMGLPRKACEVLGGPRKS